MRSIAIRKDDEVRVDCNLLFGAAPQIRRAPRPDPQGRRGAGRLGPPPQSCISSTKIIASEEQVPLEGKHKHIQR